MDEGWDFSVMEIDSSLADDNFINDESNIEYYSDIQSGHDVHSSSFSSIQDLQHSPPPIPSTSEKPRKIFNKTRNRNRSFRLVPLEYIQIGCNSRGKQNTRYIVPEENDPNLVKEYTKTRAKYDCIRCRSNQKRIQGKIIGSIFYAPEFHLESCFPISRAEAEERLQNNNDKVFKKTFEKQFSTSTKRKQRNEDYSPEEKQESPIEIITIDDSDSDDDEEFINDRKFEEECSIKEYSPDNDAQMIYANHIKVEDDVFIEEYSDQHLSPILQRIKAQNEYLAILASINESRSSDINDEIFEILQVSNSTVTSDHGSNFSTNIRPFFHHFNHPSNIWLKNACQKLQLIYHQNAYRFWANIDITQISENSKPNKIQRMKEGKDSGFQALSFLISGQENENIKTVIYANFLQNFKSLEFFGGIDFSKLTNQSEIINQSISAEFLSPELWEMIAKMLECRIGIFIEDQLVKYGNWNFQRKENGKSDDYENITLLFQIIGEDYCIVKSLVNNV